MVILNEFGEQDAFVSVAVVTIKFPTKVFVSTDFLAAQVVAQCPTVGACHLVATLFLEERFVAARAVTHYCRLQSLRPPPSLAHSPCLSRLWLPHKFEMHAKVPHKSGRIRFRTCKYRMECLEEFQQGSHTLGNEDCPEEPGARDLQNAHMIC
jgi:hypothetical protein